MFSPAVAGHLSRVYSPNLITGKVDVIDPETFKVIDSLAAIPSPQHIVPSWDLQTLWVTGDISYRGGHGYVMPIDPKTGKPGKAIEVPDAYNMYFTPDGNSAIVVAEAMRRLEFRDPHTMALQGYIDAPQCAGINHADFSLDGSYAIFTCEFNDALVKIDLVHHKLVGTLNCRPATCRRTSASRPTARPSSSPTCCSDGVVVIDGDAFKETRLHPDRRRRARALSQPRRQTSLYVTNRGTHNLAGVKQGAGSVSVIDFATPQSRRDLADPGRRQPRHGQCQRRRQMALAVGPLRRRGLRHQHDGRLGEDDPVGGMPHGLTVWPQPGRYSLGHTGNMR